MVAQFKPLPDGLSNDEKLRLYLRIIEDSNQGVMVSDAQERIVVVNAAFTRFAPADPVVQTVGVLLAWLACNLAGAAFHHAVEQPLSRLGRAPR